MILPETIFQDLRYGARMLCRNPGFTAVAVLALALGIGVNTAVFTAYKAMVARPLDARDPGEMVNLALIRDSGAADFNFSYPDYEAYRDSVHSFSGLIAFSPEHMSALECRWHYQPAHFCGWIGGRKIGAAIFRGKQCGVRHRLRCLRKLLQGSRGRALRGRTFESISIPELVASPSVLISENYWQKRFAGDPAVLGKTIHLNGVAVTDNRNHAARLRRYQCGRARFLASAQPRAAGSCRRTLAKRP